MVQPPIDFGAKSDRELLLLVAQTTNVIVQEHLPAIVQEFKRLNGTVRENSTRLTKLEVRQGCDAKQTSWYKENSRGKVIASVSGAIALLMAVAFGAGKILGWW